MGITFRNIGVLLMICLNTSCMSQEKEMTNTKWVFDFEGCQDYIKTKENSQYEFYSCESGDTVFGEYSFENDTLVLTQLKGEYDDSFDESSRHRTPSVKFKLVLDPDKLRFIERRELNPLGEWYKSSFDFPPDYEFRREK
jgi:hypothetical protein